MWKVTNKTTDLRKFRNRHVGKDILVEPKKSIITDYPPEESDVWKIELVEEEKPKMKKHKEDDE